MYLISKLFTYIFLPPSIFIWLLVLGGFLAKKFKPLFFGGAILFYLLSIKPITNLLLTPLETIDIAHKKGELVVVLSGGSNPDDILKSAPDAFKRVTYGIVLAKTNNIPLLFTGGGIIKPTEDEMAKKDIELFQNSFNFLYL